MKKLISIFILCLVAVIETAAVEPKIYSPAESPLKIKSWNQLKGVPLRLEVYGLYDNGRLVNSFYPSEQRFNEGEILTTEFGGLKWYKVVQGNNAMNRLFDARVDGLTLHTSSPEEDITWIKILEVGKLEGSYLLLTVDNRNTYRWYVIDMTAFNRNVNKGKSSRAKTAGTPK